MVDNQCPGYSIVKEVDKVVTGNWFCELSGLNRGLVIDTEGYLTNIERMILSIELVRTETHNLTLVHIVLAACAQVIVKLPVGLVPGTQPAEAPIPPSTPDPYSH
jgi:hypothetical protein